MSRATSFSVAALAAVLLVVATGPAVGAVAPAPVAGPGAWSLAHPVWFDVNGDGIPQSNELTGYPVNVMTGCTVVMGDPSILGVTQTPCANVWVGAGVGGTFYQPSGVTQTLSSNAAGTQFTFTEQPAAPPTGAARGVRALAPTASGTGTLLDLNGDGIYDTLQVQGSNRSGTVPTTNISLAPRDATGDGRPDYITVPWTTSGAALLGVNVALTPQIYVPLTDTNGDGWPDTITAQVAGGISTTTGPPLSGAALVNGLAIPSASTFGLFVFAAAIVALGVKLLRGTIVPA